MKFNKRSKHRKLLAGAKLIWPRAQKFFDELLQIEITAAQHGIRGPAASSDAWPLDGPFTAFERTAANVDAYCTWVSVKRVAAAAKVYAEMKNGEVVGNTKAIVRAAELAASSPASLYTRSDITETEAVILACLAEDNETQAEKALGWVGIIVSAVNHHLKEQHCALPYGSTQDTCVCCG